MHLWHFCISLIGLVWVPHKGAAMAAHKAHAEKRHITVDKHGVAWISGTRFKIKDLIEERHAYGWSPEEIRYQHYNRLSLAQIHAAFCHYYEHQKNIDLQIRTELEHVEELRLNADKDSDLSRKLRQHLAQK